MNEETVLDNVVETPENVETNEVVETPRFKAWEEKKENDKAPVDHIPYSRFKEVNDEKKTYQKKLEEYEEKVRQYEERESKLKAISSPKDLNIGDFETPEDYLAAREDLVKRNAIEEFERRAEALRRETEARNYEKTLADSFNEKVEASVKYNPEVRQAVEWINSIATHISPEVRYAMITDENAGDLIHEIATNPDLLKKVVQGNPIDAIRSMARWSAKFTREEKTEIPKSPLAAKTPQNIPSVPKTIKGTGSVGNKKDPSNMSMSEFRSFLTKN